MGSGHQYWPWVHIRDEVGIMEHIISNNLEGVFLGVSPEVSDSCTISHLQSNKTTNEVFTKTLGEVLHRPTVVPVPEFALKLMLGEAVKELTEGMKLYQCSTVVFDPQKFNISIASADQKQQLCTCMTTIVVRKYHVTRTRYPKRTLESGYKFHYPKLKEALENILHKK